MEGFYVFGLVCLFYNERLITQTDSLKSSYILCFNPVKSEVIDCGRDVLQNSSYLALLTAVMDDI